MNEMSNELSSSLEFSNLYNNPKFARRAYQNLTLQCLARPAIPPIIVNDKDGNPTEHSQIQRTVYDTLMYELGRAPYEAEMMQACQQYYSRSNITTYATLRDTAGAKPIDESKMAVEIENDFAKLTDEELDLLIEHREAKAKEEANA